MPRYSQETTTEKKLKSYKNHINDTQLAILKELLERYSTNSIYKFYDGEPSNKKKNKKLKSPKKAKKRSCTLALKGILPSIDYSENRKKVSRSDRDVIHSLLTESSSTVIRQASDSELRLNLTYKFIEHLYEFQQSLDPEDGLNPYLLTFSCESWFTTYEKPEIDVYRAKEIVTALLRNIRIKFAIGVFEIQPLHKNASADPTSQHTLMPHFHVIVLRKKWKKREFAKFRKTVERRLSNNQLESPVHRTSIGFEKNDILRVSSYLTKLPIFAKRWNAEKGIVNSESPLSRKHLLRIMEILSHIPLKTLVFAVGPEAVKVKNRICNELTHWDLTERGSKKRSRITLETQVVAWRKFWMVANPDWTTAPIIRVRRNEKPLLKNS